MENAYLIARMRLAILIIARNAKVKAPAKDVLVHSLISKEAVFVIIITTNSCMILNVKLANYLIVLNAQVNLHAKIANKISQKITKINVFVIRRITIS